jgi:hypothetical protein
MAVRRIRTAGSLSAPPSDGVTDADLVRGLAGYVRAVAALLQVSREATAYEVSDTATAYVALNARSPVHPGRDLMLVWTEGHGWALAVETNPAEEPAMLAYLGPDPTPEPAEVARFVDSVLTDPSKTGSAPPRIAIDRRAVGELLSRYAKPRS